MSIPVAARAEALSTAIYEDGCVNPPRTDHAAHTLAALSAQGWQLVDVEAAVIFLHRTFGLTRQAALDAFEATR